MKKLLLAILLATVLIGCRGGSMDPIPVAERVIITFDWESDLREVMDRLIGENIKLLEELDLIAGVLCYLTPDQQDLLKKILPVRYIEQDYEVAICDIRSMNVRAGDVVPSYEYPDWGLKKIRGAECWPTATGKGVKVGVIDTGIFTQHPDLQGAVKGGYSVFGGSYEDDNNHGTYVSSIIGARKNGVGIIGIAPDCDLYAIKVLNSEGRGYASDIVKGYQWALDQELAVVNLSLGAYSESQAMRDAMTLAAFQGLGTVAAAGNDGRKGILYPARNDIAVCVGAMAMDGKRASWSNYGPALKANGVMAPGEWVLAANKKGTWQRVDGTSIATPYVTGTIALLLEMKHCVREMLFRASSLWNNPDEEYGYGILDARKALDVCNSWGDIHAGTATTGQ